MLTSSDISRARLARLRDAGTLSRPAWEAAMALCGFTPGKKAWLDDARHLLLLGGSLFLLAGLIFFIASNWAFMHRFARLGLTGLIVAATGFGALWRGPTSADAASGRLLLLACGIAVGPMLAVFGQTYQSGAELWELFRVWAAVLLALAIAGRQAALWFTVWLTVNLSVMSWCGVGMEGPSNSLDAAAFFITLPELALTLALALAVWEGAAWKLRGDARHAWLQARWLPRLLFFDLSVRLTACLCIVIFSHGWRFVSWHMPHWPLMPALCIALVGLSWYWNRLKTPDLFMPACSLAGGAALLLCLLLAHEFLFDAGFSAFFVWGVIIVSLSAGIAKILLALQQSMARSAEHMAEQADAPLSADAPPPSPWYVRCMLALGGWIAAILFTACIALLFFEHGDMGSNESATLLIASLPPLGAAFAALRREGAWIRSFGFAMALAGTACACAALGSLFDSVAGALLSMAALIAALCVPMNSASYRFAAAAAVVCLIPSGIMALGVSMLLVPAHGEEIPWSSLFLTHGMTVWWAALGVGLALFLLREGEWRGSGVGKTLEPMFYGVFAGMMLSLAATLAPRFTGGWGGVFWPPEGFELGVGSAVGLIFLVWRLTMPTDRSLIMTCALLTLPLGFVLPGAALALFGLVMSRQLGSLAMRGVAGTFLFASLVQYYYVLAIPLYTKSLLLAGSGAVLLGLAFALRASRFGLNAERSGEPIAQAMDRDAVAALSSPEDESHA